MNKKLKKILVKQHRQERYHNAIQKYIDSVENGTYNIPRSYVQERYEKLKEVKG